jgi:hypothetical protein
MQWIDGDYDAPTAQVSGTVTTAYSQSAATYLYFSLKLGSGAGDVCGLDSYTVELLP